MTDETTAALETLARVRRIETRLTKVANHLNLDVGGASPRWDEERKRVSVDSLNCSLADLLRVKLPPGHSAEVFMGDEKLMTISVEPRRP